MNRILRTILFLTAITPTCIRGDTSDTRKLVYAVEINGTLCGYSEILLEPGSSDETVLKQRVHTNLTALGSRFESNLELTYHLAPDGGFTYHDSKIDQGDTHLQSVVQIQGQAALFDYGDGKVKEVQLSPDTLLENTVLFPHLVRDFVERGAQETTYRYLEVRDAAIQTKTYQLLGRESLELAGTRYDAVGLEQFNQDTGLRSNIWIDSGTGKLLRAEYPGNRVSYLADPTIRKQLQPANLDQTISAKANVSIPDYQGITYMKVSVETHPSGNRLTEEDLNVPGQRFSGTVVGNRVIGTFEVEHPQFDGGQAPPFPADYTSEESVQAYLVPDEFIESADPTLKAKAEEITRGSRNSWEAATRLSSWVAKNIDYGIPGGVTARKTYEIRSGECGAHSFLTAAFCRSVGIPARVVWGAIYVPSQGGVFGQHAWNEVFMGKAGWIAVDATANETDYLDSGHIRIGEYRSISTALNPVRFEVLDYRVGANESATSNVDNAFSGYLGSYTNPDAKQEVKVEFQDSSLAVNIVGKTILALNPPNPDGRWMSKITESLYCTFSLDPEGQATELVLHQLVRMRKTEAASTGSSACPPQLQSYLGKYFLPQANAEFTVLYDQEQLAINDPLAKKIIHLKPLPGSDKWIDEFDKNQVYFEETSDGGASYLVIDSINRFTRAGR